MRKSNDDEGEKVHGNENLTSKYVLITNEKLTYRNSELNISYTKVLSGMMVSQIDGFTESHTVYVINDGSDLSEGESEL